MTVQPYSRTIRLLSGFLLLSVTGVSQLAAQEADDETIYELSPFTVVSDSDIGYQATSTLTGSRLNTPLRDVEAPISVVTEELFDDLGATDAASLLAYTTSMEVTGVQGNFAGGVQGSAVYSTEEQRTQPQSNGQRVRGLAKAAVGYKTLSVVEGAVTPDLSKPFFDDSQLNGDFAISYNRPLLRNKLDWKVQLSVINLILDSDYIPVTINPDGRVAVVRNPPPVDIFLSNTFSF